VAELVDAHDSKSCALGRAGSIPALGTIEVASKGRPLFLLNINSTVAVDGPNLKPSSCHNFGSLFQKSLTDKQKLLKSVCLISLTKISYMFKFTNLKIKNA